jgi:hypothetical protein
MVWRKEVVSEGESWRKSGSLIWFTRRNTEGHVSRWMGTLHRTDCCRPVPRLFRHQVNIPSRRHHHHHI